MASQDLVAAINGSTEPEDERGPIVVQDEEKPSLQGLDAASASSEERTAPSPPQLRRTKGTYAVDRTGSYVNNLMWQVGVLELSNAMDFPANIWNEIPTPTFAVVLMAIGGSIAILWSIFPFWDMRKSLANIELLREERRFLKHLQQQEDEKTSLEARCLVQAWLDVNFRELGWECIDRVLMDVCAGISGILVGTGALMAIRGDIDNVFLASNLLSGYIGNSFLAPFALLNSFWAVFMWIRAGGERKLLSKGKMQIDAELQAKMRHHGRKHKMYAVVNGLTAIVGTVGSIMSATLWYGYVVIAPAIFTSVFSNLFWRYRMGYNRKMIRGRQDLDFDLLHTIQGIQTAMDAAASGAVDKLFTLVQDTKSNTSVADLMTSIGLYDALCCSLLNNNAIEAPLDDNADWLRGLDMAVVVEAAKATIIAEQNGILRDQERFLIEVYGRYFRGLEQEAHNDTPRT